MLVSCHRRLFAEAGLCATLSGVASVVLFFFFFVCVVVVFVLFFFCLVLFFFFKQKTAYEM